MCKKNIFIHSITTLYTPVVVRMDKKMDKYIQNSSKKTDTFWIAGLVNPEYVVFFEKSKFRSCLRNTLSFKSHYKNITKSFERKRLT